MMFAKTKMSVQSSLMVIIPIVMMISNFCVRGGAEALSSGSPATTSTVVTDSPPLVDVPVWSMATKNDDGDEKSKATTNMNLLTYATPVSISPNRLYALGLYKATKSRDNFLREKTCILQLLSESNEKHIECVRLLGGTSGKDVSKEQDLASVHGIELQELACYDDAEAQEDLPKVLPGCVRYLKLSMVGGELTEYDGGESSHDIVICKVEKMWTSSNLTSDSGEATSEDSGNDCLSTGKLRELGLITEQGRIAPPTDE